MNVVDVSKPSSSFIEVDDFRKIKPTLYIQRLFYVHQDKSSRDAEEN